MIDEAASRAVPWYYFDTNKYRFDIEEANLAYYVEFEVIKNVAEIYVTVELDGKPSYDKIEVGYRLASKIFHTIWAIIKDYMKRSDVPAMQFGASSKEPSRVRFYATVAYQLAKHLGYDKSDVKIVKSFRRKDVTYIVPITPKEVK